jgi:hypothetical protein
MRKYRPHRPHRPQSADFQGFGADGSITGYRPLMHRYRPLSRVPTAYRPHKIPLFCRSFFCLNPIAVDAVDTLRVLS